MCQFLHQIPAMKIRFSYTCQGDTAFIKITLRASQIVYPLAQFISSKIKSSSCAKCVFSVFRQEVTVHAYLDTFYTCLCLIAHINYKCSVFNCKRRRAWVVGGGDGESLR